LFLISDQPSHASTKKGLVKRSDVYGESSGIDVDEEALQRALKKQEEWQKYNKTVEMDDKKRGYNSMATVDVTVEDMEAYRMTKIRRDDPMVNFMVNDSE
jgi:pre-mRNA-processing factor SLU7